MNDTTSVNGRIYEAIKNNDIEAVRLLTPKWDGIHEHGTWNFLEYASIGGKIEIVKILLDSGIDVNYKYNLSLIFAAEKGHIEVVRELINSIADFNTTKHHALIFASENGHIEVVKELLKAKVNVNYVDQDGDSALSRAASFGHVEVVRELVNAKADLNLINYDGASALQFASISGKIEIVRTLIEAGANLNWTVNNRDGWTSALHIAIDEDHQDIIELLVVSGSDLTVPKFQYKPFRYGRTRKMKKLSKIKIREALIELQAKHQK